MDKIFEIINNEQKRQDNTVELIASENFVSDRVKQAVGSCMMLKYTEGFPAKRVLQSSKRNILTMCILATWADIMVVARILMNLNCIAAICGKKYLRLITM